MHCETRGGLRPVRLVATMADSQNKRPPGRPRDAGLPERRRREILVHAIEEFARGGYTGADLDRVARDSGCSKGTLYNYFANKGALFNAAVDNVMFGAVDSIGIAPDDEVNDPVDLLARLVRGFLSYFAANPQFVELIVQERSDFRDREQPSFARYRDTAKQGWSKRFAKMMADGRMRRMPPDRAIQIVSDLLYGTIFLNHFRGRSLRPEQQAADVLDVLLHGLLVRPDGS